MQTVGKYQIDIYCETTFKQGSNDTLHKYDLEHFEESEYIFPTMFGIKVYQNEQLIKSAIIGSIGGGTTIHANSIIFENARFLICCSDSIFCLSIPDLTLIWRTNADQAACFGIFRYNDDYIVHGEMQISRLDKNGKILWEQFGSDIFTTYAGENDFELTKDFIVAKDWQNRIYTFDYDGNNLADKKQFSE